VRSGGRGGCASAGESGDRLGGHHNAPEDSVIIPAPAQEVRQAVAVQVELQRNVGQSVQQIATPLAMSTSAVQSYLG
jgi:hypothetical protein